MNDYKRLMANGFPPQIPFSGNAAPSMRPAAYDPTLPWKQPAFQQGAMTPQLQSQIQQAIARAPKLSPASGPAALPPQLQPQIQTQQALANAPKLQPASPAAEPEKSFMQKLLSPRGRDLISTVSSVAMAAGAPTTDPGQSARMWSQLPGLLGQNRQNRERQSAIDTFASTAPQDAATQAMIKFAPAQYAQSLMSQRGKTPQAPKTITGADGRNYQWAGNQWQPAIPGMQAATPKPTSKIQEYNIAKSQGYGGSLLDYIKASGSAGVTVNNQMGESGPAIDANVDKSYTAAMEAISESEPTLGGLEKMLVLSKTVDSGFGEETLLEWKKALNFAGFEIDMTGVGNSEAMRSLAMDQILVRISKTKGAISEKEMDSFAKASPSLRNTPEGNALILKFAIEKERRKIAIAQFRIDQTRANPNIGRFDLDQAVQDFKTELTAAPVFDDADRALMVGQPGGAGSSLPRYQPQGQPGGGTLQDLPNGRRRWVPSQP